MSVRDHAAVGSSAEARGFVAGDLPAKLRPRHGGRRRVVVVGDRWSDVAAARNASAVPILLTPGRAPVPGDPVPTRPDLAAAVNVLLASCEAA